MPKIIRQLSWFIVVGSTAALVHWVVAVAVVMVFGIAPLVANVFGWLVAFGVSFAGHYRYTFRLEGRHWPRAALRFFGVSACGFALNEVLYFYLLRTTPIPYDILLALVLIIVAFFTFVASRLWAFAR